MNQFLLFVGGYIIIGLIVVCALWWYENKTPPRIFWTWLDLFGVITTWPGILWVIISSELDVRLGKQRHRFSMVLVYLAIGAFCLIGVVWSGSSLLLLIAIAMMGLAMRLVAQT